MTILIFFHQNYNHNLKGHASDIGPYHCQFDICNRQCTQSHVTPHEMHLNMRFIPERQVNTNTL